MSNQYKKSVYILFIIVVILSFLIRLLFRSNYLDDWDSVQFALAIKDYSIVVHQPHPPGYPIYVFFGRIIDIFFNDPTKSLIFMSVLFGGLSIIPVYLLAGNFFNKEIAILSSIIISLTPAHLLFSEVAMTDIISLFFVTTTVYLLYLGIESKKYLYIGSFVLGITAGIRLTDIIIITILFVVLIYRRKLKESIFSIMLTIIGISIWLIPIIIDTGFDKLIKVEKAQHDWDINARTINLGISKTSEIVINLFVDGWSYIFYIFILATLIIFVLKISKIKNRKEVFNYLSDKRTIFITVWLLTYLVYSILYNTLYISRYLLPQFAPLSIIFSYSIIKILDLTNDKSIKISLSIFFLIIIILMGSQAIAGAYAISTTIPAPVQAAEFIKNNYDHDNTIIVAKESSRHLRYYLSNYTFSDFDHISDKINDYVLDNKTIISEDYPLIFAITKVYRFERKEIYPKHQFVTFYENKDLQKQFIILEKDGWYELEAWNNVPTIWMGNDAILRIYSYDDYTDNISFNVVSYYRPRTLEIYDNNDIINKINVTTKFSSMTTLINLKKGFNIIHFRALEGCERPIDHPELGNGDTRCLGIALAIEYRHHI